MRPEGRLPPRPLPGRLPARPFAAPEALRPRERLLGGGAALVLGLGAAGLLGGGLAALSRGRSSPHRAPGRGPRALDAGRKAPATHRAARRLNHASATLALSVLADSAVEHYRGSFHNPGMFAPLVASTLVLAVSAHGIRERDPRWSRARHLAQAAAAATGVAGLGFHAWNVGQREGGLSWLNLFYGAPVGAPFALTLAGAAGAMAERVRGAEPRAPRVLGLSAGPALGFGTAAGLMGTVGEAGLLHFRGAFHNPAMLLPVTIPPAAALVTAWAAASARGPHRAARAWLWTTAGTGLAGAGFHARGVARNMGGWRNWSQNLLVGPPLPAPPSFAGLALAGLAALDLMEEHDG